MIIPMDAQCKQIALEQKLISFVLELLKVRAADASTDLVELGLASLTAMQLTVLIEEECGVELPLAVIFDCRTLGALAAEIARRRIEVSELGDGASQRRVGGHGAH
jgi:acyl carrier protein